MRLRALAVCLMLAAALPTAEAKKGKISEAAARRRSGREALDAGRLPHARHLFLQALALEPANMDIVGDLLQVDGADPEAVALWLHYAATAGADDAGKFKPPRSWPKVPRAALSEAQGLLKLRAQALKAVGRTAGKLKAGKHASLVRYLTGVQRHLAHDARDLGKPAAGALEQAGPRCVVDSEKVVGALHKLMRKMLAKQEYADALEAARILHGLHQQAGQSPGAGAKATKQLPSILSVKRAARQALQAAGETVHSLETLHAVPEPERDAWSRKHASWASPGVSHSPSKLYRVETTCGIETLLVVTEDIEHHHKRLVDWFGGDPFAERRGLVRLLHSQTDFESEGQPFWWAAGFQGGDLTAVRVNFTSRHGLAGVLTHELTHRFDGTFFPGLPSWLLEGRAVHTQTCTLTPHAPKLDERLVAFHRFWKANAERYGQLSKLEDLIEGTISDYRDNYSAGYALWIFLKRFQSFEPEQQGRPIFAPRVGAYLRSFRVKRYGEPLERFATFFLDGKAGRPSTLKAFAELFARALRDGATLDPPPWRQAWIREMQTAYAEAKHPPTISIDDRLTWPRDRERSDPVAHGERHAYAAALLLEKHGAFARARDALEWALQVDEPVAAHAAHAATRSKAEGSRDAAWAQQNEASRLDPQRFPAPKTGAPDLLADTWKRVAALRKALAKAEAAARARKQLRLARALRAEQNGLGPLLGHAAMEPVSPLEAHPAEEPPPPDCGPYVGELTGGVAELRWSPLRSQKYGLWHMPNQASIELGRSKAGKEMTGTIRDAGVRRVFVRGNRWHAGTYTFRTRVRFLSAHVDARLVVGCTRRDRGVEINVRGGDLAYATGRREKAYETRGIYIHVSDLRPFDQYASVLGRSFRFRSPREAFTISAHVDGAFLRVKVNGRIALVHRRSTGDPIQGYVGFGLESGLVHYEDPETRHHRVLGSEHVCACEVHDQPIRLDAPLTFPWSTCVGRRVEGLPLGPRGTYVLWYTEATPEVERGEFLVEDAIERQCAPFRKAQLPVSIQLVLPKPTKSEDDFPRGVSYGLPEGSVHEHAGSPSLVKHLEQLAEKDAQRAYKGKSPVPLPKARKRARKRHLGAPTWLMLDEHGIVRACGTWGSLRQALSLAHHLAGW